MKQIYLIITILMLVGCKSRTSEPANAAVAFAVALSLAPVEQQLKEAQANKKIAFLVLTSGNLATDNSAFRIVQETQKEVAPSVIIALDHRDTSNQKIIEQWSLSTTGLPAVFVISAEGEPIRGFAMDEATPVKLKKAIAKQG